jgi:hypothetical protein
LVTLPPPFFSFTLLHPSSVLPCTPLFELFYHSGWGVRSCSKRVRSDRAIGHRLDLQRSNLRPLQTSFLRIGSTSIRASRYNQTVRAIIKSGFPIPLTTPQPTPALGSANDPTANISSGYEAFHSQGLVHWGIFICEEAHEDYASGYEYFLAPIATKPARSFCATMLDPPLMKHTGLSGSSTGSQPRRRIDTRAHRNTNRKNSARSRRLIRLTIVPLNQDVYASEARRNANAVQYFGYKSRVVSCR